MIATRRRRDFLLLAPAILTVGVLFIGAVVGVAATSVASLDGGLSLDAWRQVLADPAFLDALGFTLQLAILATVVSAATALVLSIAVRDRGGFVRTALALPVPVPHLLAAIAAVVWLGPGGLADRILGAVPVDVIGDTRGAGIVAVYAWKEIPFLVLLLLAATGPDLGQREEAGAVLGLSRWQRLRWITWPALRTPLVVGSIIVAAYVVGAFEVPLVVGPNHPPTLATFALESTQTDLIEGQARSAATLLMAMALAIALAFAAIRFARDVEGR